MAREKKESLERRNRVRREERELGEKKVGQGRRKRVSRVRIEKRNLGEKKAS